MEEGGESRTEEEGQSEEGTADIDSREDGEGGWYQVQQGGGGDSDAEGGGVGNDGWRGRRRPVGEDRCGGSRGRLSECECEWIG